MASVIDRAAPLAVVEIVLARIARAEDDGVRVDDQRHTAFERDRPDQEGASVAGSFQDDRAAGCAPIDRLLHPSRVELVLVGIGERRIGDGHERGGQRCARRGKRGLDDAACVLAVRRVGCEDECRGRDDAAFHG